MGIPVIDFIIISENGQYSFFEKLNNQNNSFNYVADGFQGTLWKVPISLDTFSMLQLILPAI